MKNNKIIYFCFFLSGAAGLMYEIVWTRFFALTYGGTTYSVTTVLSAFMAGLAFGSLIFGRIADRVNKRLMLYGWIEVLIGVYALIFPYLFNRSSDLYLSIVRDGDMDQIEKLVLKFALSFCIMFIPTTLMGGSLPVMSRFFIKTHEGVPSKLGALYALNTFGAVLGTYLVGFHLIGFIGLHASVYVAAGINILIGTGIILYSMKTEEQDSSLRETSAGEKIPLTSREKGVVIFAVVAFMISGFVALSHEVVWTRILSLVIGSSTYAFTMILIGFLIGIALGSYLLSHTKLIPQEKINLIAFSWIQIGIGLSAYLLIPLFSKLPYIMIKAFQINPESYSFITFYQFVLSLVIMIVPTTLMGATLPVIGKIVSREVRSVGRSIGNIYFFNTFGAIFGAFFAGFIFIPYLGTLSTLKLGIYINIFLGIAGILLVTYKQKKTGLVLASLVTAVLGVSTVWFSTWNAGLMDLGVSIYGGYFAKSWDKQGFKQGDRLLYLHEGVNATISVRQGENKISLKTNGKADASTSPGDMATQSLLGYLPLMIHHDPTDVLVIGLGSGVTAGTVTQYDSVHAVDIVEIEPAVIEASAFFKDVNHGVVEQSKARVFINDGRNQLLERAETYDIIISEPSNPWISGVAGLYTTDYFQIVNEKLNPKGIFCQWIHLYSMAPENLKMILKTMALSFEDLQFWISTFGDALVIASNEGIRVDLTRIAQVMNLNDKTKKDFRDYFLAQYPAEIPGRLFLDKQGILDFSSGAAVNSDNYPYLEFQAPKALYIRQEGAIINDLSARRLRTFQNGHDTSLFYFHRSKLYTNIFKSLETGEFYINKAIEADRSKEDFYFHLAKIALLKKNYDSALNVVSQGLKIHKTSTGIKTLYDIYMASGQNNKALALVQENREILDDYEIRYALLMYQAGQYQQAIPYLKTAIEKKQEKDYFLLFILGNCYKALNRPDMAEKYYLQSIEKDEMHQRAHASLLELYWTQKKYEDACRIFSFLQKYWDFDSSLIDESRCSTF